MTNCGRSDALCPANSSAETTLSSENRATDWADTGVTTINAEIAEHAERKHTLRISDTLEHHVARVRGDPGQRGYQRADDFGVELGAGAAPQLAQRVAGRT